MILAHPGLSRSVPETSITADKQNKIIQRRSGTIGRQRSPLTDSLTVRFPIAKSDFVRYRQGVSGL